MRCLPHVRHEQWYAADVFVLPTMHDPSANAVTEALACGTPVITSSETVRSIHNGVNGYVLRSRLDAAEIAAKCADLCGSGLHAMRCCEASGLISTDENAQRTLDALIRAGSLPACARGPRAAGSACRGFAPVEAADVATGRRPRLPRRVSQQRLAALPAAPQFVTCRSLGL